jgi:hypothetical protein
MAAIRRARPSRKAEDDEAVKRPAPGAEDALEQESDGGGTPAFPDLNGGPLEPDAWLALQHAIGNSAVGGLVERRRAGQSLPADTRHDMEASFGRDFGQVQIHAGPEVDQAAQALDAAAFTVGDGIYVHSGVPGFEDPFGRQVLGEELAHVAQGAGVGGVGRVTDTGERAEKEARAAGRAAAAGENASVDAAPQMESAVARFEFGGVLAAAGEAVNAAVAAGLEKTELTDDEKDRLSAGALFPLKALWTQLGDKMQAAKGGKPSAQQLQPIADNSEGIGKFIYSFAGPAAIQESLERAAASASAGHNALLAAINPQQTLMATADAMATAAAEITGLASVPAAAPAAGTAPAASATTESLTPAEADQLKFGAADPLAHASEQLKSPEHDLDTIIDRLANVPGVLQSFTKPASLVPQLRRKALSVEIAVRTLVAVHGGAKAAVSQAMGMWQSAIITLEGLTVKSPGGGTPKTAESTGTSDDEDKKKPD